jgi:hypothetical protein
MLAIPAMNRWAIFSRPLSADWAEILVQSGPQSKVHSPLPVAHWPLPVEQLPLLTPNYLERFFHQA